MAIRVEGNVAYVGTIAESFEACDLEGVEYVVVENNADRIALQRLLKGFGVK